MITVKEEKFFEGDKYKVSVKITNSGAKNATVIGLRLLDGTKPIGSTTVDKVDINAYDKDGVTIQFSWIPSSGDHKLTAEIVTNQPYKDPRPLIVTVQPKPIDYSIWAYLIIVIMIIALMFFFVNKQWHKIAERRAEKERQAAAKKLAAEAQSDFSDLYAESGTEAYTSESYEAAYGTTDASYGATDAGAYDDYASYSAYGTTAAYTEYKCPRCGNPTTEHGVQCFACDAKDSVKYAEDAIKEVKELGIDVDEAETLLTSAKASLKKGNYETALEEAEDAEDIAAEVKERYDAAFAMISEESAESAAERRRKRLERRRAAREKKGKEDELAASKGEDE
jgi:hypothetical protein